MWLKQFYLLQERFVGDFRRRFFHVLWNRRRIPYSTTIYYYNSLSRLCFSSNKMYIPARSSKIRLKIFLQTSQDITVWNEKAFSPSSLMTLFQFEWVGFWMNLIKLTMNITYWNICAVLINDTRKMSFWKCYIP